MGAHLAQAGEHGAQLVAAHAAVEHVQLVDHHGAHVGQRLGLGGEQRIQRFRRGEQQVGGAARVEGVQVARLHGQRDAQGFQRRRQPIGHIVDQRAGGQEVEDCYLLRGACRAAGGVR